MLTDQEKRLYQEFAAIDRDNSGQISREEFTNWLCQGETHPDHIPWIVNDIFKLVDIDGSGYIEVEEFVGRFAEMEKDFDNELEDLRIKI